MKLLRVNFKTLLLLSILVNKIAAQEILNSSSVKNSSASAAVESFYFLNQGATTWNQANENCQTQIDKDAHVLYIETEAELEKVRAFIRDTDDFGGIYWIGGKWDVEKQAFVWGNGISFGSWVPWAPGQPSTMLPVTTVSLSASDMTFRTAFQTESLRFICEIDKL